MVPNICTLAEAVAQRTESQAILILANGMAMVVDNVSVSVSSGYPGIHTDSLSSQVRWELFYTNQSTNSISHPITVFVKDTPIVLRRDFVVGLL